MAALSGRGFSLHQKDSALREIVHCTPCPRGLLVREPCGFDSDLIVVHSTPSGK